MSIYSDDKNPHIINFILTERTRQKYREHLLGIGFQEGYQYRENEERFEGRFTDEEKWVLTKLKFLSKPCLDDSERITLESLEKKVLGNDG